MEAWSVATNATSLEYLIFDSINVRELFDETLAIIKQLAKDMWWIVIDEELEIANNGPDCVKLQLTVTVDPVVQGSTVTDDPDVRLR
jgi:hypothetical protein